MYYSDAKGPQKTFPLSLSECCAAADFKPTAFSLDCYQKGAHLHETDMFNRHQMNVKSCVSERSFGKTASVCLFFVLCGLRCDTALTDRYRTDSYTAAHRQI